MTSTSSTTTTKANCIQADKDITTTDLLQIYLFVSLHVFGVSFKVDFYFLEKHGKSGLMANILRPVYTLDLLLQHVGTTRSVRESYVCLHALFCRLLVGPTVSERESHVYFDTRFYEF